jgi:hypothetical protein
MLQLDIYASCIQDRALLFRQVLDSNSSELSHFYELVVGERNLFSRRLDLDESIRACKDEVHINFCAGIFFVREIEQDFVFDDADADCSDEIAQRKSFQSPRRDQLLKSQRDRDKTPSD